MGVSFNQYVYLKHQPIAKLEDKQLYAIHSDHLGTPRVASNDKKETVWKANYSPFGKAEVVTNTITLSLRLPGQYEDQETGTHYNYLRDYDPNTGRYVTSDPIGLKGGVNTYAYVGSNPIQAIDPLGLYRLVMGFEVNDSSAFIGGIHDLNKDYGHMYFYLVDNNEKISDVFSFGPAEQMTKIGEIIGVEGTIDYGIGEESKLFNLDINTAQYFYILTKVKGSRINPPRYWTAINQTCASTGLEEIDDILLNLGLPNGKSKIKLPNHIAQYTDGNYTTNGVTTLEHVNPYALHSQMLSQGRTEYTLSPRQVTNASSTKQIQTGILDPLLTYDYIKPIITLNGNSNTTISVGTSYTDPGAIAIDNIQGTITVTSSGTVDTSKVGDYVITYTATDAGGNVSTTVRTIKVK